MSDEEDLFSLGLSPPRRGVGQPAGATSTTARRLMVASTPGTSGGGLGVNSVRRVKGYSIVVVNERELGSVLCAGKIGKFGGSMCIKQLGECKTSSHRKIQASFEPELVSKSNKYVMVATSHAEEAVYLSLIVPVEQFGDKLETYQADSRTVMEWEVILRSIRDADGDLEAIVESHAKVTQDATEREDTGTLSPVKKLRLEDAAAITADYEEASSYPHYSSEGEDARDERGAIQDLQLQVETAFQKLLVTELEMETHPLKELHQDLVGVRNLIGTHAEGMGPETIMETLGRFDSALEEATGSALSIEEQDNLRALLRNYGSGLEILIKKICSKIGEQVKNSFAPFENFLGAWTLDRTKPGDKLEDKILELETQVLGLQSLAPGGHSQYQPVGRPSSDPFSIGLDASLGYNSSMGTNHAAQPRAPSNQAPEFLSMMELTTEVKVLKEEVSKLKEEMGDQPIAMGGIAFRSKSVLQSWLVLNVSAPAEELLVKRNDAYICFPDATALLALAYLEIGGEADLAHEAAVRKAGYVSAEEAAFQDSYKSNLPKVFGKTTGVGGSRGDTRVLPGVKTNAEFESGLGFQSYKVTLSTAVRDKANRLKSKAKEDLSAEGFMVASACILHAESFITQLLQWMSTTYTALCKQSGTSASKDNWLYVSHAVRSICLSLYNKRSSGYGKAALHKVVWSCLQTIPLEKEFMEDDFTPHPVVSNVLNQHLQTSAVMKPQFESEMEDMKKAMKALQTSVANADRKADKAITTAAKK
jgi:hypothetical protein